MICVFWHEFGKTSIKFDCQRDEKGHTAIYATHTGFRIKGLGYHYDGFEGMYSLRSQSFHPDENQGGRQS